MLKKLFMQLLRPAMEFKKNSRIHIISIGGSVMHDLAINLKKLGQPYKSVQLV